MKLLASSADLDDLTVVVKRLVRAYIPSAICRDPYTGYLSVWVQRDCDFAWALRVASNPPRRPRLPHWATVFYGHQRGPNGFGQPGTRPAEIRSALCEQICSL